MKAVWYDRTGGPEVLTVGELPTPSPAPGEVLVRLATSGVNPSDWKTRSGSSRPMASPRVVPHSDGAGTVDEVGEGVDPARVGQRVWVWLAAYLRLTGTAQELALVPADLAVPLPDHASFELGADLGVPFLTAHRCLTVAEGGPTRLAPGALSGTTVLVAGGAYFMLMPSSSSSDSAFTPPAHVLKHPAAAKGHSKAPAAKARAMASVSSSEMPPSAQSVAEMRTDMGRSAGQTSRRARKTSSG